jgi:hypothetical protein
MGSAHKRSFLVVGLIYRTHLNQWRKPVPKSPQKAARYHHIIFGADINPGLSSDSGSILCPAGDGEDVTIDLNTLIFNNCSDDPTIATHCLMTTRIQRLRLGCETDSSQIRSGQVIPQNIFCRPINLWHRCNWVCILELGAIVRGGHKGKFKSDDGMAVDCNSFLWTYTCSTNENSDHSPI